MASGSPAAHSEASSGMGPEIASVFAHMLYSPPGSPVLSCTEKISPPNASAMASSAPCISASSTPPDPPPRLAITRPPGASAFAHRTHTSGSCNWGRRLPLAKRSTTSAAYVAPPDVTPSPSASPTRTSRPDSSSSASPMCPRATSTTSPSSSQPTRLKRPGKCSCSSRAVLPAPRPRRPTAEPGAGPASRGATAPKPSQ
mmetsp:Transcript_24167/g.82480  ORF Transcript_24167/g.82480 Transcript_24167/m.82480 type:complete len:200 (+) Transcript_24167:1043-1642(+)